MGGGGSARSRSRVPAPVSGVGGRTRLAWPAERGRPHPKGRNGVEDVSEANIAACRSGPRKERRPPRERGLAITKTTSRSDDRSCDQLALAGVLLMNNLEG